jgi:outer membrane protein assembly factor BamB
MSVLFAAVLAGSALAKEKIRHDAVEAPAWAVPTVSVDIGLVTSMVANQDLLVLGGQKGIAAVGPDGAVRWTTPLPEAMVRNLALEGGEIAFTAWTLAGTEDRAKALNLWASGKLLDKFDVTGATVGVLAGDGAVKWQVDALDQHSLAPPAITAGIVAINTGEHVVVHDRGTGAVIGSSALPGAKQHDGPFAGVMDHATRGEVVPVGDHLFTSFFSTFVKIDQKGALVEKEFMAGMTPYVDVTCGPVLIDGLIVFGSTGDANFASNVFAMQDNMKNKWKTASPDESSGCGDMVVDGDRVYASSNFWVFAMSPKGKIEWESVNKKGGLYPSANRGIRYIPGSSFGTRKSYGDLLVVGNGKVYVGTDNGHDVITVLSADDGSYVKTLDVNETIVSMAVIGDKLAVATESGLKLLALE